jgi:membrane protein required for colicin V production
LVALSRLVGQVFETLSRSVVNQVLGGAVGGGKAALLLSLLFLVLGGMELPKQETRADSTFYQPVAKLLPRTIEATENWIPAAKEAADQLSRQIRSEMEAVPESSSDSTVLDPDSQR